MSFRVSLDSSSTWATDFGPLTELISRRDVEEIFIEGARVSYLDVSGRLGTWRWMGV